MCVFSHVSHSAENGEGSRAHSIPSLKTGTSEKAIQTEPWNPEPERTPLALTRASQSLSLEDALPEGVSLMDEALHKAQQESQEEEDSEEKDKGWHSKVEETIQRTTIKSLQQQHSKSSEESQGSAPQTPTSSSPAPPKDPTHSGPLSPILEGEKKLLCVYPPIKPVFFHPRMTFLLWLRSKSNPITCATALIINTYKCLIVSKMQLKPLVKNSLNECDF